MKIQLKDFTNHQVGILTITGRYNKKDTDTASTASWQAKCLCGNTCIIEHKQLTSKKKKSCGCGYKNPEYFAGSRFEKLVILSEGPKIEYEKGPKIRQVWCQCDCGNTTLVRTNNLKSGNTTSCGCVGEESRKTHGLSSSRVYQIHEGMLRRCRPELADEFPYHAGKGITVCERWNPRLGGCFENFYADVGESPSEKHTLDRIDVKGNYEPGNVRWATNSVQGYNKGLDPNNTSGKSGVSWYERNQKWSAEIHVEGKHIRLGMFNKFEDAVRARKEAEVKFYGWNKL